MTALILLGVCACAPKYEETEKIGPYEVSLIDKNVWHVKDVESRNPSDMYIVRGNKKAVLIDLSNKMNEETGAEDALRQIFDTRAAGKDKVVAITHNHPDHVGMLGAFTEDKDIQYYLPAPDFMDEGNFKVENKNYTLGGNVIDLGGTSLTTVLVPGHTPGSTVFFLKDRNIAFCGDAIGSGSGVWIFSMEGFRQYVIGVKGLADYINAPENGIDKDELTLYGGHMQQLGDLEKLGSQYVFDMAVLVDRILVGKADSEANSAFNQYLNTNFKFGTATITWNEEEAQILQSELLAQ